MNFILISGKGNTGKSSVCRDLRDLINKDQSYTELGGWNINNPHFVDFMAHYNHKKNGKCIVVNSASDDDRCIKRFADYLDRLAKEGVRPEVVITTIRETGKPICHMLALLEAYAKGTKNLVSHYTRNIENAMPVTLIGDVSLLHLTEQPTSGNKANTAIALAPYFKNIANSAKQELDRIV